VEKKDGGNERKSESTGSRSKGRRVSEGNNVAEVDIPCIGQTESEKFRKKEKKEREKEKCRALSRVKVKIIRKFLYRLLMESMKCGVTVEETYGSQKFQKTGKVIRKAAVYIFPVYIFLL